MKRIILKAKNKAKIKLFVILGNLLLLAVRH